jgi:hypothetical protein
MIQFLKLKKRAKNDTISIILRQLERRNGIEIDTYIKKQSLILKGADDTNHTKYFLKIFELRKQIYKKLSNKHKFLYISNVEKRIDVFNKLIKELDYKELKGLKVAQKINYIKEHVNDTIIFIENMDKFAGQKLELLKVLIRNCRLIVCTLKNSDKLDETLKEELKKHDIQTLEL